MGFIDGAEWYYEILNNDGSVTYQYLQCVGDTTISTEKPKVIVRTNQIYDKDSHIKVTHEYIVERNGFVYWWNKELHEFTVLYNLAADVGDEWEIMVGTESVVMHVDAVENYEYEGVTYRMLRVSDENNIFNGDIVCGIGHLTSFFPEKLMNKGAGFEVKGLRCYWVDDALVYHNGDEDCDAVHNIFIIDENPFAESGFTIYPNPTDGLLHIVETVCTPSLQGQTGYRITNLMGQTLLTGRVETLRATSLQATTIDVSSLPAGMYFFHFNHQTLKFIKQ